MGLAAGRTPRRHRITYEAIAESDAAVRLAAWRAARQRRAEEELATMEAALISSAAARDPKS